MKKRYTTIFSLLLAVVFTSGSLMAQEKNTNSKGEGPVFPEYSIYTNAKTSAYIKPIIGLAGTYEYMNPDNPQKEEDTDDKFANRMTTHAVARFGLEGNLGFGVSFKSEFQRDPGNYGTGTWEGTISMSAKENWVRYEKFGASISAGIIIDPASFDFVSAHINDMFMNDRYTKPLLLFSGANGGQGILFNYNFNKLAKVPVVLGFSYTSCNPLASSESFPFGGNVSALGDLNRIPRGATSDGNPGSSNTEMQVYTPSLMFNQTIADTVKVEFRGSYQVYKVYIDKTNDDATYLFGTNWHGALRISVLDEMISVFGNYTNRENDMYKSGDGNGGGTFDYEKLEDHTYKADTLGIGMDFNWKKKAGIGVNYFVVSRSYYEKRERYDYLNIGASYNVTSTLTFSVRRAYLVTKTNGEKDDGINDYDSWFAGMRLSI